MIKLILLRHAKSSWKNYNLADHERPLSKRGKNATKLIGKYLKKNNIIPDYIICSTANRTKETIKRILDIIEKDIPLSYDSEIYLCDSSIIIEKLAKTNDDYKNVMVVGHNPTMEDLVETLTGNKLPHEKFSTCGVGVIDFPINSWNEIKQTNGKLELFIAPKMLED